MALVPYAYQRAFAAETDAELCVVSIGQHTLRISQDLSASGSNRCVLDDAAAGDSEELSERQGGGRGVAGAESTADCSASEGPLRNVGLRVWQCAFILTELLLRAPPFGQWAGVRVVDLGAGTGVTGIGLAQAGASVMLTDLPHITPLTQRNVDYNCQGLIAGGAEVEEYEWGAPVAKLGALPDIITAADCLYQPEHYPALLETVVRLSQPHTMTYLAYRQRGNVEEGFAQLLADRDFHVQRVSPDELHEEFRSDMYVLLKACRLGGDPSPSVGEGEAKC